MEEVNHWGCAPEGYILSSAQPLPPVLISLSPSQLPRGKQLGPPCLPPRCLCNGFGRPWTETSETQSQNKPFLLRVDFLRYLKANIPTYTGETSENSLEDRLCLAKRPCWFLESSPWVGLLPRNLCGQAEPTPFLGLCLSMCHATPPGAGHLLQIFRLPNPLTPFSTISRSELCFSVQWVFSALGPANPLSSKHFFLLSPFFCHPREVLIPA